MSLAWKLNRLRAMSAREIAHRAGREIQNRLEECGIGLARPAAPMGRTGRAWLAALPREFAVDRYQAAADRILQGRFSVFALRDARIGFPPRWNRDPKTGREAPLTFGKRINYRDAALVGDIKYLWELNRHLELVTLAQAWHLTGRGRYAEGCRALLESWFEQCPYPVGANWTSSLEHAIRLANWCLAWHLLGGESCALFEGPAGAAFRLRWLSSVRQHCHFIAHHLSRYSSANNHVLGELMGLFIGATVWRLWPESAGWQALAFERLEEQALQQNAPDGVNREQAAWYQHAVTDMMLLSALIGRANGCEFSRSFWQRVEVMLEFVASIMDVSGNVPMFGDSDDGVVARLCPGAQFNVYRSLLATGAVLFGRGDFKVKAAGFDDKSRWLLGDEAARVFESVKGETAALPIRRAFPVGGYYILGDAFETQREIRIVADAGPLGYLSIAAHGHADALSFVLSVGGTEMLVDPGTYAYHTDRHWRDYFRGTAAHNTVRIDGRDQSLAGGDFLWLTHAAARCRTFETGAMCDRWLAEHEGYSRLPDPVRVRRELVFDRSTRVLRVIDSVICETRHRLEIFWHFAEECAVDLGDRAARVQKGNAQLVLRWPEGLRASVIRGREHPPAGWISRTLDVKGPCRTLVVSGEAEGTWNGLTEIAVQ